MKYHPSDPIVQVYNAIVLGTTGEGIEAKGGDSRTRTSDIDPHKNISGDVGSSEHEWFKQKGKK